MNNTEQLADELIRLAREGDFAGLARFNLSAESYVLLGELRSMHSEHRLLSCRVTRQAEEIDRLECSLRRALLEA